MAPAGGHRSVSTQEHQFAVSNTTVNKFLGGRQPSWMTNAKPVKPTPRPPNQPPKQSLPEQLPAPRISSRPVPPHHSQQKRSSVVPAAPAATASDSPRPSPQQQQQQQQQQQPQPQRPPPPLATNTGATPAATPFTVLPSPAPSEEPSPAISAAPEPNTRACESAALVPAAEARPAPVYATEINDPGFPNLNQAVESGSPSLLGGATTPAVTDAGTHTSQAPSLASGATPAAAAPAITLPTPPIPRAPASGSPMTAPSPFQGAGPEPQAKRRRLSNMSSMFLQSLNAGPMLDQHVLQSGGEGALDFNVERPRYQLLREACLEGDLFFVALHQMFCAWSCNNSTAHELCVEGVHDTSFVDNAFGLMGTILKSNAKIRPVHIHFFSNFPRPLWVMRSENPVYATKIIEVLNFLVRMSRQWMVVNHNHGQENYPLLMDELLGIFGLLSPILQTIVFRASRRSLGISDGHIGNQMDELFRHDQQAHRPPNGEFQAIGVQDFAREPSNAALIQRYQALVAQAHRSGQISSGQMSSRASTGPPPPPTQQQYQNPSPQPYSFGAQMSSYPQPSGHPPLNTRFAPRPGAPPTMPSNRQTVQQGSYPPPTSGPQTNNFAFSPQIVTPTYQQLPPMQMAASQGSPVSPATTAHYPNIPFAQSPRPVSNQAVQFQGQPAQFQGQPASPYPEAVPSPQSHPGYPQSLPSRRTSQQFIQAPITHSPQMQNLVNSPLQRNISPSGALNVGGQVPVTQQMGFSPRAPPSTLPGIAVHHHHRLPAPSTLSSARNAASGMLPNNTPNGHGSNHVPAVQGQFSMNGQQVSSQQLLELLSPVSPNSVRPQPPRPANNRVPPGGRPVFFIDPSQYPHDPYERKSLEMSLHQAHLRSPRRVLNANSPASNSKERYYQAIKYLALPPTPLPQRASLYTLKFSVSEADFRKISPDTPLHPESCPVNMFFNGSLRLRLRACFLKSKGEISEDSWVLAETSWPEQIFMQLNERVLTVRRKQHHAKDQPVEIGMFVVPGLNVLRISVPLAKHYPKDMTAFIAVEVVETLGHNSVLALSNLLTPLPSSQTRETVVKRLGGSTDPGDDEIAIAPTDLSINLADPFSYTMWTVPVRGHACTHLECFDLDTWLTTRPSKKSCICGAKKQSECRSCPKEPSLVDKWKCPLCQGDARPYSLRIDGFMVEVRNLLTEQNLLNVKEIKVSPDGSWNPVIPDDDSDLESDEELNAIRALSHSTARSGQKRSASAVEVICLDDD